MACYVQSTKEFLKVAPDKLKKDYFIQTWGNDEGYALPFAKVRKLGTVYVEATSQKTSGHKELFVDILPYDEIPKDAALQRKKRMELFRYCNTLNIHTGLEPWNQMIYIYTLLLWRVTHC